MIMNSRLRRQMRKNQERAQAAVKSHPALSIARHLYVGLHPDMPINQETITYALIDIGVLAIGSLLSNPLVDTNWERKLDNFLLANHLEAAQAT
ncbi:hypothetical protein BH10CHL1_BH10CHL1_18000 [soil metagenome]